MEFKLEQEWQNIANKINLNNYMFPFCRKAPVSFLYISTIPHRRLQCGCRFTKAHTFAQTKSLPAYTSYIASYYASTSPTPPSATLFEFNDNKNNYI